MARSARTAALDFGAGGKTALAEAWPGASALPVAPRWGILDASAMRDFEPAAGGRRETSREAMGAAMSSIAQGPARDWSNWAFFALLGICLVGVIYTDERFLVDYSNPEWKHIAPFRWLLLVHGLAGATAIATGAFQFSDTIRRTQINLHRWTGRVYITAACFASMFGGYIGVTFEKSPVAAAAAALAIGWFTCTAMALLCVLRKNIPAHKGWMMKSYGFALAFVSSRVPDIFGMQWTDALLANVLWFLVGAALIGPDLILTTRELWRKRRRAAA
jgi:Predicted membrane protein (DUF2306)